MIEAGLCKLQFRCLVLKNICSLGIDMWRIFVIAFVFGLAACQQEDEPLASGLDGYDPHSVDTQSNECAERGGRFGQGGLTGTFVCYEKTRDANKSCSASSDCEGECLARSRTCSPVTPMFGCNDVLTNAGRLTTVCTN